MTETEKNDLPAAMNAGTGKYDMRVEWVPRLEEFSREAWEVFDEESTRSSGVTGTATASMQRRR